MHWTDLSGKSVYDLDQDDFEKLFCRHCKQWKSCQKTQGAIHSCMGLIDSGIWDATFRKREGDKKRGEAPLMKGGEMEIVGVGFEEKVVCNKCGATFKDKESIELVKKWTTEGYAPCPNLSCSGEMRLEPEIQQI